MKASELAETFCPFCASSPFLSREDLQCHVQSKHHEIGSDTDDSTDNVEEHENGENYTCTALYLNM